MKKQMYYKALHKPSQHFVKNSISGSTLHVNNIGSKWYKKETLEKILDSGKFKYVKGSTVISFEREDFEVQEYSVSLSQITGEQLGGLLFGIHQHDDRRGGKIFYYEKDLLKILKFAGLPAPEWGKSYTIKELKNDKRRESRTTGKNIDGL